MDSVSFPRQARSARRRAVLTAAPALPGADFDQLLDLGLAREDLGTATLFRSLRCDATVSGRRPTAGIFPHRAGSSTSRVSTESAFRRHATRVGASYYQRIGDLALFPAFAGFSIELGDLAVARGHLVSRQHARRLVLGGVSTPVGPVYIGYGRAEGGEDAFYVTLGQFLEGKKKKM